MNWRWWVGLKPKFATRTPDRKYSISVVIPAWNEEKSIAKTIDSVKKQTVEIEEIVVVDDCSTDNTGKIARDLGCRVIRSHTNQGTKARAQQYALDKLNTDLVVTIDADTILDKDAVKKTLPYFNDLRTASVCGFVVPARIKSVWERGRFIEYLFGITVMKKAQNHNGGVIVSSGCFSVFCLQAIRDMGGFKERTMAEDMDLTWEFWLNGYHIYYTPEALCYPYDPPTFKIYVAQVDRWLRSFFQNIVIHRKQLHKNLKLSIFVYGYLSEFLISPFLLFLGLWFATKSVMLAIPITIAVDVGLVFGLVLVKGIQLGVVGKVITSLPSYLITRTVNFIIFWRSLWKEWIVKERLLVWQKGH